MTSRERVLKAFKKIPGNPDRVPVQFDLCRKLTDHFGKELGIEPDYALSYYEDLTYRISANRVRTALGSDVVVVGGTVADGYRPEKVSDTITKNEFGMHMQPGSLYVEVVKCPLDSVSKAEDVERYAFPDPLAPGRFEKAKRDIRAFGKDYYVIGDVELSIFELAWHLTGMENYLVGLISEEPWVDALNDRVEYWTASIASELVRLGVDAVWFGEDLGSQTSTLISPEIWRARFKYRYERIIKSLRSINPDVTIIMHSDGAVAPLIDDWIEIGIDVFNPVQPNVPGSDPDELKRRYGEKILFFGGVDQQELLPRGDSQAIRAEVSRRLHIFGKGRGYLCAPAHIVQADVSPETVKVFIDTVKNTALY